ncbi:AAA family ATPase [Mucilaginibacter sp. Bleaf8]|uniref:HRDC domain-containing protein n=1 Tax=Mucilaginibacter sp. Bleaf8 TaxID=2834430 RepID=UPI001BCCC908|nr:HRDC domain-containing protein [Mucilaginibacter sp. Bleaf8]MBS7566798.1 AAA family ATPase [Mucilaginibacter sp. Bleaf8]
MERAEQIPTAGDTDSLNEQARLLLDFLMQTREPVFLTGKAGTGKTTLLRYIRANLSRNLTVAAPTAVAALNAGGVTLHSLFQIPFGPVIPQQEAGVEDDAFRVNFSADKRKLLRCLEVLIIDEISMVRADTLDYVDRALRWINGSARPFGGVQVLLIGDLYQLPPVVNQDWQLLHKYYASPYFFDSQVIKSAPLITFELTQVYRQSDPVFIDILNGIRSGQLENRLLDKLNAAYRPSADPAELQEYITLTTHNGMVTAVNRERLESMEGTVHTFKATISGDFPKDAFPVEEDLMLKAGAQVMFTKNDSSGKKQYYNGRMGKVIAISNGAIQLRFQDDGSEFTVLPEIWRNVKYALSETDGQIAETDAGSFTQYPLRLAWAITIHKSQGLTFDRAVVDVSSAFAHGQAYVALSRCRSLEGLVLNAPVEARNLITDPGVIRFMASATSRLPDRAMLEQAVCAYERNLIEDMLNFDTVNSRWKKIGSLLETSGLPPGAELRVAYEFIDTVLTKEVSQVAHKFLRQEVLTLQSLERIASQPALLARLQKAAAYFGPKLESSIAHLQKVVALPWAPAIQEAELLSLLDTVFNLLVEKRAQLKIAESGFTPEAYLAARKAAAAGYKSLRKNKAPADKQLRHLQLYESLLAWRKDYSEQQKVMERAVLSDPMLRQIAEKLPRSVEQLAAIKSIGPAKARQIGNDLIRLVNQYLGADQLF